MAYRKLTGQISHRHPFHGDLEQQIMKKRYIYRPRFGEDTYYHTPDMYDFDPAAVDKLYKGVQGCVGCAGLGQDSGRTILQQAVSAIVAAGIVGAGTYFIAKALKKSEKKSMQWGTIAGGVIGIASIIAERRGA